MQFLTSHIYKMYYLHIPFFAIFLAAFVCADPTYYTIWPRNSPDLDTNKGVANALDSQGISKMLDL